MVDHDHPREPSLIGGVVQLGYKLVGRIGRHWTSLPQDWLRSFPNSTEPLSEFVVTDDSTRSVQLLLRNGRLTAEVSGGVRLRRLWPVIASLALASTACAIRPETGAEVADAQLFHPDGWPGVERVPDDVFDPVAAGEPTPTGFRQVFGRDGIRPVYVPNFVTADEIEWPEEELVVGIDLAGEARAYPVGFLNRREIVVDMHRGIPTFITW